MKKVILFFLVLFSLTSSAQLVKDLTQSASNVIDSTKVMMKETSNLVDTSSNFKMIYTDAKEGLYGLAQGLKVGVEHVYTVLVKQQIVNSTVNLLVGIFALLSGILCYIQWGKINVTQTKYSTEVNEIRPVIFTVCFGLLSLILTIVFFALFSDMVMGFINPEYGAIKDIINFVQHTTKTCSTCR